MPELSLEALLPSYSPSTILDLGANHFYSMAHEVLVPTIDPRSEISRLQQEVCANRKHGKVDTAKELNLLYHQRVEGMADFTYVPLLGLTISQAFDRWNRRGPWREVVVNQAERIRSRLHISATLYELTCEMDNDRRTEFLSRAVLAALSANDRAQVLSDLETYMGSQC